ncbi:MAG: DUF2254 domain-containing protein, partial [Pedobacter sp.]
RQLMEVAVKALSPGINDPGTAILSLQALGHLLKYRSENHPEEEIYDDEKRLRIIMRIRSVEEIFSECVYPIWDYGKQDRLVNMEFHHIMLQLCAQTKIHVFEKMLDTVNRSPMHQGV